VLGLNLTVRMLQESPGGLPKAGADFSPTVASAGPLLNSFGMDGAPARPTTILYAQRGDQTFQTSRNVGLDLEDLIANAKQAVPDENTPTTAGYVSAQDEEFGMCIDGRLLVRGRRRRHAKVCRCKECREFDEWARLR
jgi:hypothetical protein